MDIDSIHISILLNALVTDIISSERSELIAGLAKDSKGVAMPKANFGVASRREAIALN